LLQQAKRFGVAYAPAYPLLLCNPASPHRESYCELVALAVSTPQRESLMVVCVCNAIRECEVRKAAQAGARCPASAYRSMGRKPRCGQCFSFAREIIGAELATA